VLGQYHVRLNTAQEQNKQLRIALKILRDMAKSKDQYLKQERLNKDQLFRALQKLESEKDGYEKELERLNEELGGGGFLAFFGLGGGKKKANTEQRSQNQQLVLQTTNQKYVITPTQQNPARQNFPQRRPNRGFPGDQNRPPAPQKLNLA